MILFEDWALPDGETHLQEWMNTVQQRVEGRLTYQYNKYSAAMELFGPNRRTALDIGAHVGLWSYWMARDFKHLHAFEPIKEHRECWMYSMMGRRGNVTLHACALGNRVGMVGFSREAISSGSTYVDPAQTSDQVLMQPLDSLELQDVDFIKIDVEGHELDVIQGGLETIRRCRPLIVVEQKGNETQHYGRPRDEAVALLKEIGMKSLRKPISEDWFMGW